MSEFCSRIQCIYNVSGSVPNTVNTYFPSRLSTETRKSLEERKMSKLEVLGLNEEAREDVEQKSRKRARDGAERDDEAA